MNIGQLFMMLGFKTDMKTVNDFIQSMGDMNIEALLAAIGVGATALAMIRLGTAAADSANEVRNFEIQTGLSGKEMQQWGNYAETVGVKAEDLVGSLKGLQKAITAIRLGRGDVTPFQMLGVDPTGKPLYEVVDEIGQAMKGLEPAVQSQILAMMGMSDAMMNLYRSGKLLKDSAKDMPFLDDAAVDKLTRLRDVFVSVGQSAKFMLFSLVSFFAPAFELIGHLAKVILDISRAMYSLDFSKLMEILKPIGDTIKFIIDNIDRLGSILSGIPQLAIGGPAGLGNATASMVGSRMLAQSNQFNFQVTGNDETLARKIMEQLRRAMSDTIWQAEQDNR